MCILAKQNYAIPHFIINSEWEQAKEPNTSVWKT
jgi:hypothetical protein